MTNIIATIGPASENIETLSYFAQNKVEIVRLNFSHNTPSWHIKTGLKAKSLGMKTMVDLVGPKVLIGNLENPVELKEGELVILEAQKENKKYPTKIELSKGELTVLPTNYNLKNFLQEGRNILINDGKFKLKVQKITKEWMVCMVLVGGQVKTNKGINLPQTELKLDFLDEKDLEYLEKVVPVLQPNYIAPSFVKNVNDMERLKTFVNEIIQRNRIQNYQPRYAIKLELSEAMTNQSLPKLIEISDMVMFARGDLALETEPNHLQVPFLQQKVIDLSKQFNRPVIIATQILESMTESPVPTRAEVSDLYRAIFIDRARYVMLSGETAAGKYSRECIKLMSDMINLCQKQWRKDLLK